MPFDLTLVVVLIYALAGMLAGLIGGMLGLGGGIVLVPMLYYVFLKNGFSTEILMHVAVTTSLATIIVTSISASYTHHKKQAVLWPLVFRITPGILIGAALGAMVADVFSSNLLRILFGVFEILVAIQIAFDLKPDAKLTLPGSAGLGVSGIVIGLISTLLGIGGGTITVPFLLWCKVQIRNAVAVSSACGFPIALAGTTAMIIAGWDSPTLPANTIGYLYWPAALVIMTMTLIFAPLGAKLTHYLPVIILKRIFALILLIVGVRMLLQG